MLGGGYYRGASVLITGFPGTAKTTLSGAFAEAACRRGERTMFVSFDSDGTEVIRNLASVGIQLDRYVKSGSLAHDLGPHHHRQRGDLPGAHQDAGEGASSALPRDRSGVHIVEVRQRADRAQRGGAADRLVEGGRHHAGLHQPARRDVQPDRRRLAAADLDARGHMDSSQLSGAGRGAQPRPVHHQVARHGAFEPGARADPERRRA